LPHVIERINQTFVSTWILVDDLERLANHHNPLARTLSTRWEYPIDLMFVSAEGELLSKLNSFKDFRNPHRDVGQPSHIPWGGATHEEVFLKHLDLNFNSK